MYRKLAEVLLRTKGALPAYFKLLEGDLLVAYGYAAKLHFETPCFWSGETTLAQHPAVITTEAGFIGHKEVVAVHYNPEAPEAETLQQYAAAEGFFPVEDGIFRADTAPQYYLRQTPYKFLPLSKAQRTQLNWALPYQADPEQFLSPKQLALLAAPPTAHAENYRRPIAESWNF